MPGASKDLVPNQAHQPAMSPFRRSVFPRAVFRDEETWHRSVCRIKGSERLRLPQIPSQYVRQHKGTSLIHSFRTYIKLGLLVLATLVGAVAFGSGFAAKSDSVPQGFNGSSTSPLLGADARPKSAYGLFDFLCTLTFLCEAYLHVGMTHLGMSPDEVYGSLQIRNVVRKVTYSLSTRLSQSVAQGSHDLGDTEEAMSLTSGESRRDKCLRRFMCAAEMGRQTAMLVFLNLLANARPEFLVWARVALCARFFVSLATTPTVGVKAAVIARSEDQLSVDSGIQGCTRSALQFVGDEWIAFFSGDMSVHPKGLEKAAEFGGTNGCQLLALAGSLVLSAAAFVSACFIDESGLKADMNYGVAFAVALVLSASYMRRFLELVHHPSVRTSVAALAETVFMLSGMVTATGWGVWANLFAALGFHRTALPVSRRLLDSHPMFTSIQMREVAGPSHERETAAMNTALLSSRGIVRYTADSQGIF